MSRSKLFHGARIPIFALILLGLTPAAYADENWKLRVAFASVDSGLGNVTWGDHGWGIFDGAGGVGVGVGFERRLSRLLGLELEAIALGALEMKVGSPQGQVVFQEVGFVPLTVGINLHLTPEQPLDLYLGPRIGIAVSGSSGVGVGRGARRLFDERTDLTWGVELGADLRLGNSRWSLGASVEYLQTALGTTHGYGRWRTHTFDPLIANVGFGYRF